MKKVVLYTTDFCRHCHAAKQLLKGKGVDVEEINVQDDEKTRKWLVSVTGQMTVPQIFIDDKSIGGFRELQQLEVEDKLDGLLGI